MSFSLHDTLPKVGDSMGMEFYNKLKLRTVLEVKEFNNKNQSPTYKVQLTCLLTKTRTLCSRNFWFWFQQRLPTWSGRSLCHSHEPELLGLTFQTRNLSTTLVIPTPELRCICIYIYSMKFDLLQEGVPYSFPFFEAYMFVKA